MKFNYNEENLGRNLSSVTFRDRSMMSCDGAVCLAFGPQISKIVFIDKILDMSRAKIERAVTHCAMVQPEVLLDNSSFLESWCPFFKSRTWRVPLIKWINSACDFEVYYDNHLNHAPGMKGTSLICHNSTIQLTDAYRIYILKKRLLECLPSQNASHCVHHAKRYYHKTLCLVFVITVLKASSSPAEVRCLAF